MRIGGLLRRFRLRSLSYGGQVARRNDEESALASRPRRAADEDHIAVTGRGILVGEAGDQDASVEGDDLAVLLATGRSWAAPLIFSPPRVPEAQFPRHLPRPQLHT